MTRLIVLGSGTALPDADRSNSCYIWESPAGLLMLDCGGAPYERMLQVGLEPTNVRALFLSHNHPDHVTGLPAFLLQLKLASYKHTLHIFGNQSALHTAQNLVAAAELGEHSVDTHYTTLEHSAHNVSLPIDLGIELRVAPTYHSRPTLALRIDPVAGASIVYGADSGPCAELVELARGAHTLIHECTVAEPYEYHSTPEQAATTAQQAGVEQLILTHYSPRWTAARQTVYDRASSVFKGAIQIADDGATVYAQA